LVTSFLSIQSRFLGALLLLIFGCYFVVSFVCFFKNLFEKIFFFSCFVLLKLMFFFVQVIFIFFFFNFYECDEEEESKLSYLYI